MPIGFPIYRRLMNGQQLSSEEVNALLDYLAQQTATQAPTGASVGVNQHGQPVDFRPQGFWARLTDEREDNRYGWVRCTPRSDGSINDEPATAALTDQGTPAKWPAVEVGGSDALTEGTIVWLEPGQGAFHTFSATSVGGVQRAAVVGVACDALGQIVLDYSRFLGPTLETPPTGEHVIEVVVTLDAAPVEDRTVRITLGEYEYTALTDEDGEASFDELPGGLWNVTVDVLAGETGEIKPVELPPSPASVAIAITT